MKESTAVRKPELVLRGSGLLPHAAVHSVADGAAPTHDGAQFGQEFSRVPAHAADLAESCPVTPRRCPFGGACHSCPVQVQAKLVLSQPDDEYEREAERVAETVMRMPAPEEDKEPCRQPGCVRTVQRQAADGVTQSEIPPIVHEVLRSPGQPLDAATRAFMEPRLRHDLGHVRVHTDAKAAESARTVNALAYTVGRDMVFGAGRYAPETIKGRELMAHELAHVVQQRSQNGPTDELKSRRLQRAAIYQGRILDEGSCEHLACNSSYACEDNQNGIRCPTGTRNASATKKYRPLFTCDFKCEAGQTCSDSDNWMAIPRSRFANRKCGQDLVICAGGQFTHGYVRDKSEREAWEVSHGIQDALGLSSYATFTGAIYGDEKDAGFKQDTRCHGKKAPATSQPSTATTSPPQTEPQANSGTTRLQRAEAPHERERQLWLSLRHQSHYGVLEGSRRTPMASTTRNQQADEILWVAEALLNRAEKMKTFLRDKFGLNKDLQVTSVVKPGHHTLYRKMDVIPAGTTTWEELAAAAVHAGFWVHAEGVTLDGKFWPMSPGATGAHLDLYLIQTEIGDFPLPKDVSGKEMAGDLIG